MPKSLAKSAQVSQTYFLLLLIACSVHPYGYYIIVDMFVLVAGVLLYPYILLLML